MPAIQKTTIKYTSNSSFFTHCDIQTLGPFKPFAKLPFVSTTLSSMDNYNSFPFYLSYPPYITIYIVIRAIQYPQITERLSSYLASKAPHCLPYKVYSPQHQQSLKKIHDFPTKTSCLNHMGTLLLESSQSSDFFSSWNALFL